jgi:hypothetical protein
MVAKARSSAIHSFGIVVHVPWLVSFEVTGGAFQRRRLREGTGTEKYQVLEYRCWFDSDIWYIYIDRLDILLQYICLKYLNVSSSLRWSFQIVPSISHQKSSWLCEAVFCQDRIAKRMVEEAEKTLGSAMGRQNCTGEFPHRETMADRGRPWWSGDLRSGRIKPGPGLSLLGALLGGFYFDFAASDDPKISIYQPHSARWHPHWGHQRQHWRRPVHGLCHQRPVVAS